MTEEREVQLTEMEKDYSPKKSMSHATEPFSVASGGIYGVTATNFFNFFRTRIRYLTLNTKRAISTDLILYWLDSPYI